MKYTVEQLKTWFLKNRRSLPWRSIRKKRDPYKTWISEIMLQQTQVETVKGFYQKWMEQFPTIQVLAKAKEEDVLKYWAGLGYYSRAKNILKSAKIVVEQYKGILPVSKTELLKLPGIGEYTAGAILSLANNQEEPILDGNLIRVFSRYYGLDFLPISKDGKNVYWGYAKKWVEGGEPRYVNEGLMELGALVCLPIAKPLCDVCPIHSKCYAFRQKLQKSFPPEKPKKEKKDVRNYSIVVLYKNHVLLYKRQEKELLKGHYVFPEMPASGSKGLTLEKLEALFPKSMQGKVKFAIEEVGIVKHAITHHRIQLNVWKVQVVQKEMQKAKSSTVKSFFPHVDGCIWVPKNKVDSTLVSSLPKKVWKLC